MGLAIIFYSFKHKISTMKRLFTLFTLVFSFLFTQAQLPTIIPYQGSISDTSGSGFDGSYNFDFRILNSSNTSLWSSGTISLPVVNGNYSVSLGAGGQPAIPKTVFELDEIYLEVSFNDGINGKETLSPNVRILPVPYALRAAYADSASNKANFGIGDSLVLRDKNGDVRMVLNPNTGEFKMLDDDTVWYNVQTNSPPKVVQQLPNGGSISQGHREDFDGSHYLTTIVQYGKNKGKVVSETMTQPPNGDPNPLYINSYLKYCINGVYLEYSKHTIQYVRDTLMDDMIKYAGIHVEESWYDCNGGLIRFKAVDPRSFTRSYERPGNTVVETVTDNEHRIIYTVGKDTFQSKINPKTGEIRHSKKWISHVVGMEGGKTIATYNNDQTGKSSSTTVDPDKNSKEHKNQDIQFYLPENNQQCFGTALGNGDTLWFYMNTFGFEFNDLVIADGIKSDSFVAEYDGNRRVVIAGDDNGNSSTRYYDDLDRVIEETNNPGKGEVKKEGIRIETYEYDGNNNVVYEYDTDGSSSQTNKSKDGEMKVDYDPTERKVTYDGYDRVEYYDERDLVYQDVRDSGKVKSKISNDKNTVEFKWEYDANENLVMTEANGSQEKKQHRKDSTFLFIWSNDAGQVESVVDPSSHSYTYESNGTTKGTTFELSETYEYIHDNSMNSISRRTDLLEGTVSYLGVSGFGLESNGVETGIELTTTSSWFGSTDTAKKTSMAIGFTQSDSTISLVGGRRYIVSVPTTSFQSFYDNGTSQMGMDWDFITSSKTTLGVTTSQTVFNSNCALIQESPNGNELMMAGIDSNNNQLSLQMIPSQGLLQLDAGRNPTYFSSSFVNTDNSLFVNDTAFINKFAAVNGNMQVGGNLFVNGNISKGGGTFRIDHPQDPYNKYLYHSFIESPDMMNIYNGNAETDENGEVVVELPDYFESLNMDFRYQLTCIGSFAQAIVGEEIEGNKFTIMTDKPNVKVSWQVTGIRKDPYANDHRVEVEVDKEPENIGTLLYTPNQTAK